MTNAPTGVPIPAFGESPEQAAERRGRLLEVRLSEQSRVLAAAAEELAAELRRRKAAEASLVQSKKLEAVGLLGSSVAHDFNNVLQAVIASFDQLESGGSDAAVEAIREGRLAVQRGAALARRLLLLARPVGKPGLVRCGQAVDDAGALARLLCGAGIDLETVVPTGLWPVLAEEGRLEMALLNLAINARDAMPDGGKLSITASNVTLESTQPGGPRPGQYVLLSVADTGVGMDEAVIARSTEAFFTTKQPGAGTGLGLSTSLEFASDCGGALRIASRKGQGTRVDLYLPRATPDQDSVQAGVPSAAPGGGVLLLVEENGPLREAASEHLRRLGYQVVAAAKPAVALALSYSLETIDLVLASETLPDGGATKLARDLRIERPWLEVLRLAAAGAPSGDPLVLVKPFAFAALAASVQRALAGRQERGERELSVSARILESLRSPELREALVWWRGARSPDPLPRLELARAVLVRHPSRHFIVAVDAAARPHRFQFVSVGQALVERLDGALQAGPFPGAGPEELGTKESVYALACASSLPVYDHAVFDLGGGTRQMFERLVFPVSEDGVQVSHLIGIVVFAEAPSAGAAQEEP